MHCNSDCSTGVAPCVRLPDSGDLFDFSCNASKNGIGGGRRTCLTWPTYWELTNGVTPFKAYMKTKGMSLMLSAGEVGLALLEFLQETGWYWVRTASRCTWLWRSVSCSQLQNDGIHSFLHLGRDEYLRDSFASVRWMNALIYAMKKLVESSFLQTWS